ncbi:YggS family pyridoxal phosphate-dependent enzyme [Marininema mesophilum]|nr:YggS family pyridoxal phosphate-dependent enzyme [Marininema mesophilum]
MDEDILTSWRVVKGEIDTACRQVNRDPEEINVVTVTKYVDQKRTQEALDAGLLHIGESRVQDAVPKWEALGKRGIWHFIGHLQRNKAKAVVGKFSYLHSLDRFSLAEELSKRCDTVGENIRCFLQVNVAGEESKFGLSPKELPEFAREVSQLPGIQLEGLMTMAPYVENPEEVRPIFRHLRVLRQELRQLDELLLTLPHLSMGMSRDYRVAIEEGATYIRLGSVLVGGGK